MPASKLANEHQYYAPNEITEIRAIMQELKDSG